MKHYGIVEDLLYYNYVREKNIIKDKTLVNPKDFREKLNFLQNISSRFVKNIEGKLYLGNLCKIPRYKVKEYINNNNNIFKTNCYDLADIIVINDKILTSLINDILKYEKIYRIYIIHKLNKEHLKLIGDLIRNNPRRYFEGFDGIEIGDTFVLQFEEKSYEYFLSKIDNNSHILKDSFTNALNNFINSISYESYNLVDFYRSDHLKNLYNLLDYLINNPDVKIILDSDFLKLINNDGLELDWDSFDGIDNMFLSADIDNIFMAFDILSNVNLENNIHKISYLFNKYKYLFEWGSGIAPGSNKSYKMLVEYFKVNNIVWKQDWSRFINDLINKFPNKKEDIKYLILNQVNSQISKNNIYSFKITDVDIK